MPEPLTPPASNFTLYPIAWLAAGFAVGIYLARNFSLAWPVWLAAGFSLFLLTYVLRRGKYGVIFLLLAFVSAGGLSLEIEKLAVAPNRLKVLFESEALRSGEPFDLTGTAAGKPEPAVGGAFLVLDVERIVANGAERHVSGRIRLFLPATDGQMAREYEELRIGHADRIRVACELLREEKYQNPGGVSARKILDQQGIDATGIVKSPLLIENLGSSSRFRPLAALYERRADLIVDFKSRFSVSTAGVLIASLLGNKYHLDKTTAESFREGGTFHILVISGLQITFIGGLAILILRQLTRSRFWQFLLASVFLWSYTLAVGADVPVTRAAIMFTFWYFAYAVFRQATLLNTLAVSALVLLVWDPSALFDQSFQLTFMCVLAIVAIAVPLLEKLQAIGRWRPQAEDPVPPNVPLWLKSCCEAFYWSEKAWQRELGRTIWQCRLQKNPLAEKLERVRLQGVFRFVFETLVVSIIVQIWLIPLAIIYFHRISLASILLNVPVGALMAIESLLAIAGVMAAGFSEILAAPFIWAAENLNFLILRITFFFIGLDWSSLRFAHYSGSFRILYYIYFLPVLAFSFFALRWNPFSLRANDRHSTFAPRLAGGTFLLLLILIIFHPLSAPPPDGRLRVDFLDVGQGDSALVTMPNGETLLIDGGGRANFNRLYVQRDGEEAELFEPDTLNIGESVVSNFLWERGLDKVDYLLATHADTDHIQGLTDVARNFRIRSAIIAASPAADDDFAGFNDVLTKKRIPTVTVRRGDVLTFGDVRVEVLHPTPDETLKTAWDNNHSIVLRIIFGETSILLTGDLEKEGERELLARPDLLRANIVKVGHHGSKTSSLPEFIDATKAKLAIVSVGRRSPFGHPDKNVVERWKQSGAKVMTTGENGTITIESDGRSVRVGTYTQNQILR